MVWRDESRFMRKRFGRGPYTQTQFSEATELFAERNWAAAIIIGVIAFMLFVMAIGLSVQITQRNRLTDRLRSQIGVLQATVEEARTASKDAKKAVEDAIKLSTEPDSPTVQVFRQIAEGSAAVKRIEACLKAGTCKG